MSGYFRVKRSALVASAALTAALSFTTPATAASRQPAVPGACHPISGLDSDEHTGQMWAYGYTSCNVFGPALMRVNIWVDNTSEQGTSQSCPLGTNCYTASGMITPASGRHRYCSQVWFYWAGTNPTQSSWSCEYLG